LTPSVSPCEWWYSTTSAIISSNDPDISNNP
jgi:hypothetical protein